MSKTFFIGGPLHGEWLDVPKDSFTGDHLPDEVIHQASEETYAAVTMERPATLGRGPVLTRYRRTELKRPMDSATTEVFMAPGWTPSPVDLHRAFWNIPIKVDIVERRYATPSPRKILIEERES